MAYSKDQKQTIINIICIEVAKGKSLRNVLRDKKELPPMKTIFEWLALVKDFSNQYAGACEERAIQMFEDMFEIADDGKNDYYEKFNGRGESKGYYVDNEALQRSKLRVDTRKWALSKMFPKKYGEKIEIEQTGDQTKPVDALSGLNAKALLKIQKIIEEEKQE